MPSGDILLNVRLTGAVEAARRIDQLLAQAGEGKGAGPFTATELPGIRKKATAFVESEKTLSRLRAAGVTPSTRVIGGVTRSLEDLTAATQPAVGQLGAVGHSARTISLASQDLELERMIVQEAQEEALAKERANVALRQRVTLIRNSLALEERQNTQAQAAAVVEARRAAAEVQRAEAEYTRLERGANRLARQSLMTEQRQARQARNTPDARLDARTNKLYQQIDLGERLLALDTRSSSEARKQEAAIRSLIAAKLQKQDVDMVEIQSLQAQAVAMNKLTNTLIQAERRNRSYGLGVIARSFKQQYALQAVSSAAAGAMGAMSALEGNLVGLGFSFIFLQFSMWPIAAAFGAIAYAAGRVFKAMEKNRKEARAFNDLQMGLGAAGKNFADAAFSTLDLSIASEQLFKQFGKFMGLKPEEFTDDFAKAAGTLAFNNIDPTVELLTQLTRVASITGKSIQEVAREFVDAVNPSELLIGGMNELQDSLSGLVPLSQLNREALIELHTALAGILDPQQRAVIIAEFLQKAYAGVGEEFINAAESGQTVVGMLKGMSEVFNALATAAGALNLPLETLLDEFLKAPDITTFIENIKSLAGIDRQITPNVRRALNELVQTLVDFGKVNKLPFTSDGDLNLEPIQNYMNLLASSDVVPGGSLAERLENLEAFINNRYANIRREIGAALDLTGINASVIELGRNLLGIESSYIRTDQNIVTLRSGLGAGFSTNGFAESVSNLQTQGDAIVTNLVTLSNDVDSILDGMETRFAEFNGKATVSLPMSSSSTVNNNQVVVTLNTQAPVDTVWLETKLSGLLSNVLIGGSART